MEQAKQQVIENLGVVVSEGERLTKLIDDVLDLAKIEAGKFTWNMATVSMSDVIERALPPPLRCLKRRSFISSATLNRSCRLSPETRIG